MKPGVHQLKGEPAVASFAELRALASEAGGLDVRRSRLCAHASPDDDLHEMLIALHRDGYVRPHRHHGKPESALLIEGSMDVVFFSAEGRVERVLRMDREGVAYYRLTEPLYHTMLVRSATVVFHEVTRGPFRPEETEYAPWAPAAEAEAEILAWRAEVERQIDELSS